jgi:hypothetical protein
MEKVEKALSISPRSGECIAAGFPDPYFPYYLRAAIHLSQGRAKEADHDLKMELDQGEIQKNPEFKARLEQLIVLDLDPPRLDLVTPRVLDIEYDPTGTAPFEKLTVEVAGRVFEKGELQSILVNGEAAQWEKVAGDEDTYAFVKELTVEASSVIRVEATDNVPRRSESTVAVPLSEPDIGPEADRVHAVVVGVDRYRRAPDSGRVDCILAEWSRCADPEDLECTTLNDLAAAANDARRIAALLRWRGVPERNIRLIVSDEAGMNASKERVLTALDEVRKLEGGTVIFYFSGHGFRSQQRGNLLVLSDSEVYRCKDAPEEEVTPLERTALAVNDVAESLRVSAFDHRYVILDACRVPQVADAVRGPGQGDGPGFDVPDANEPVTKGERIPLPRASTTAPVVFYGTGDKRTSVEWVRRGSGYFTWYLLQALRLDISLRHLDGWVQDRVSAQTRNDLCPGGSGCELEQLPHLAFPEWLDGNKQLQDTLFILSPADGGSSRPSTLTGP